MTKYIGIKLRTKNQSVVVKYYSQEVRYQIGDPVIIQVSDRIEDGKIVYLKGERDIRHYQNNENYKLLRKATPEDLGKIKDILQDEKEASKIFRQMVIKYHLDMKLVIVEISFDQKYITFYFSAETRLDFRELLKDLIKKFHKLVRLQQVGPRDEAKLVSGIGPCGRELCCCRFLNKLESVSSDLARLQRLSQVSSSKISGACGKLMCCLTYEAESYRKMAKNLPKIGETVETKEGPGKVIKQDIINQGVKIKLASGDQIQIPISKLKKGRDD